eukprot:6592710-Alexandrium_andersonii.AAC.1
MGASGRLDVRTLASLSGRLSRCSCCPSLSCRWSNKARHAAQRCTVSLARLMCWGSDHSCGKEGHAFGGRQSRQ